MSKKGHIQTVSFCVVWGPLAGKALLDAAHQPLTTTINQNKPLYTLPVLHDYLFSKESKLKQMSTADEMKGWCRQTASWLLVLNTTEVVLLKSP